MTLPIRLVSVLGCALLLSACSSAPVRYHTLLAPSSAPLSATAARVPFVVEVLPVGIPAQLDQPQLVVRQDASSLTLLEGERWAAPLADEFRQALSAELSMRLGTQDVAGLSAPPGRKVLRLKVQVRRLDAWPSQAVELEADWRLRFADERENALLVCGGRFRQQAAGDYAQLVKAQQAAVAALAERISADARRFAIMRDAACLSP
ncbi:membrane integrity-associated transporter subunit PqiC [uncultured Oxalicibacterium sp.]|uniref:PqiC family protein n=1 Tax=uncultured Oxalicibacterium sp. TaxID=1168540 RepID=UPI0025EA7732|nr:PqiC family protein [uncultured Oxalicibacterium sp.]